MSLCGGGRAAEKKAREEAKKLKEAKLAEKEKEKAAKAGAGGDGASLAELEKKLMPQVKEGDILVAAGDPQSVAAGLAKYQEAMVKHNLAKRASISLSLCRLLPVGRHCSDSAVRAAGSRAPGNWARGVGGGATLHSAGKFH